jgi:hypothetical protein
MALPLGFGTVPFGLSSFGIPPGDPAVEGPTVLRSSRSIDPVRGILNVDDDGNFVGMDDIAQRVVLAVKQAKIPELQTRSFDEEVQQEIRRVLVDAQLTIGNAPTILLVRKDGGRPIQVTAKPNGADISISYLNNLTGTETSIEVDR